MSRKCSAKSQEQIEIGSERQDEMLASNLEER